MGASLTAMLTCKQVARTIAADELATAGWRRRLSVRLHLVMCRHCRRYARQLRAIGGAARRLFDSGLREPGSRERLRRSILDRVAPPEDDARTPRE